MEIFSMLYFPSFLPFLMVFTYFPLVFLRFPRVFLIFPFSFSSASYFSLCGKQTSFIKLLINSNYDAKTRHLPKFVVGPSIIVAKENLSKFILQKGLAGNLLFWWCESWYVSIILDSVDKDI